MTESSSKWRKRGKFTVTERDLDILIDLLKKKYMDTSQILRRHWRNTHGGQFGALKSCQRRLRQLEAYGLIRRIQQAVKRTEGSKPDLFTLDKNSVPLLVSERAVNPKWIDLRPWVNEEHNPQVKHLLETTNVQIKWQEAGEACGVSVEALLDEKEIRLQYVNNAGTFVDSEGKTVKKPISDTFTIINRDGRRAYFWIEVDRANINIAHSHLVLERPSVASKVVRFLEWEASHEFVEEFGDRPLRKLFITRGEGRLHNMLQVTEQVIKEQVELPDEVPDNEVLKNEYEQRQAELAQLSKRFLFTTFEQFYTHNPLTEAIWSVVGSDAPQALL